MRRTRLLQLVTVVTVAALAAAFAAPAGAQSDRDNVDGELVFGHIGPETGQLAAIIDSLRVPIQIAIDEINAAGGVNDTPVRVVTGDDGSTEPDLASQTLDRMLTSDKVDVVLGPAGSGVTLSVLEKLGSNRAFACTGSATAADLSAKKNLKDAKGYFRRTAPPDRLQGPALAELVLSDGHSSVGLLVRNDSYGVGFGKALQKALKQGGADVVGNVAYNIDEGANYDSDVQQILDEEPDALVVIGFNDDGAKVIQSLIGQGAGPADLAIYTADGMQGSTFAETVDPADPSKTAGIKGTAPAGSPAGIESPFQDVFAATGTDPIFSAYYYDCTILAALAAVKAETDDPAKLRAAFNANLKGDEDCNTFATCKDLLEDGSTIHWRGASSDFEKFGKTEPGQGVYEIWSYDAIGSVETEDASTQISIG